MFKATIEITPLQIREILCQYLKTKGIDNVSHQDISFIIETKEYGDQKDFFWTTNELKRVEIKNIKIGE